MTDTPGLDAATEELFASSPAEFVARRDELAKQAGASGDRSLAAAIKALRRHANWRPRNLPWKP
ncbi:MAG: hypothetical protein IPO80_04740 [Propionibacteriaceae bacterium]|nr:hypothetical protein [Propionibacteriaceae bacterium]